MSRLRPPTRARRRVLQRRRQVVAAALLLGFALAGFRFVAHQSGPTATASDLATTTPGGVATAVATATDIAATPPTPAPKTTPARPTKVRATGVYARAPGGTVRHGSGPLVTYRVEVEIGTGQSASAFAEAVDATLGDPASWAGQGRWSVRRVTGDDGDLVIRLATPATVGKVCEAAGLDIGGYASCQTGNLVMINLDRWLHAVPDYRGDVALYRHYVINHEVGHGLGFGHQACPGRGRPAPVMMQQTYGLNGCTPNGWPYVAGVSVSGPAKN